MGKVSVLGTMEKFHNLTRLCAREDFIEVCRHESFKAYNRAIYSVFIKNRDNNLHWREHTKRTEEHIPRQPSITNVQDEEHQVFHKETEMKLEGFLWLKFGE
jgi:CRISPR/Cas system-associated protein endoribonuclease Cas2